MTDTPETDAISGTCPLDHVDNLKRHARTLERQRDAYAETLRLLRVECYDFIDQRHPELAQEGEKGQP